MIEAISRITASAARVVVLGGNGKIFCAGGDIGEFLANKDRIAPLVGQVIDYVHATIRTLANLPVPVICALNGPVGGAGIGYALCGDFVLASDTLKLRGGYCGIGLSPDGGASYFLTRRVGAARAKQIFMLNRALSAEDCLRLGVVDEVHPADQLAAAVDRLARELASGPTGSYARTKRLCDAAMNNDLATHLDLEAALMQESAMTADFHEGIAAFRDKRAPQFAGV
jgi:2-(1,2-epoxy-1,2-dihydrophenyl)acetyl-CoA isomerase